MATFQPFYIQKPATPVSVSRPRPRATSLTPTKPKYLTKGLMMPLSDNEVRRYALMYGVRFDTTSSKEDIVNAIFKTRRLVVRLNMKRERSFRVPVVEKTILKNRAIGPSKLSSLQLQVGDRTMRPHKESIMQKAREVEKEALVNWILGKEDWSSFGTISGSEHGSTATFLNDHATPVSAPAPIPEAIPQLAPLAPQTPPSNSFNLLTIRPLTTPASASPQLVTVNPSKTASRAPKTPSRVPSQANSPSFLPTPSKTRSNSFIPTTPITRPLRKQDAASSMSNQPVDATEAELFGGGGGNRGLFGMPGANPFAGPSRQGGGNDNDDEGNGGEGGGPSGSGGAGGPPSDDGGDDGDDGDDEDDEEGDDDDDDDEGDDEGDNEGDQTSDQSEEQEQEEQEQEEHDQEEEDQEEEEQQQEGQEDNGRFMEGQVYDQVPAEDRDDSSFSFGSMEAFPIHGYQEDPVMDVATFLLQGEQDARFREVPLVYPPPTQFSADHPDWLSLMFERVRRERTNLVSAYDDARAQLAEALAEAEVVEAQLRTEQSLMHEHMNSIRSMAGQDVMEKVWGMVWGEDKNAEEEKIKDEHHRMVAEAWTGTVRSRRHVEGQVTPPRATPEPVTSSDESNCKSTCDQSSSDSFSGPDDGSPALRAGANRVNNKRRRTVPDSSSNNAANFGRAGPSNHNRNRSLSTELPQPLPKRPRLMRSNAVEINAQGVDTALRNRLMREADVPFNDATRIATHPPPNYWQMPPEVADLPRRDYEATREIFEDDGTPPLEDAPAAGGSGAVAGPSTTMGAPPAPPRVFFPPTPGRQWRGRLVSSENATLNTGAGTTQVQRRVFFARPAQTQAQAGPSITATTGHATLPTAGSGSQVASQTGTRSSPRRRHADDNAGEGSSAHVTRAAGADSSSSARSRGGVDEEEDAEHQTVDGAAQQEEEAAGNTSVMSTISAVMARFLSRSTHPFFLGLSAADQAANEAQNSGEESHPDSALFMNETALQRQYDAEASGANDDPYSAPLS